MLKSLTLAVAAFAVAPGTVFADEVGKISAEIDGIAQEFYVISVTRGEKTVMTASFGGSKRLPGLHVQGHPEPRFTTTNVLSIDGSWFNGYDPDKPISGVEIIFMPEGMSNPFYTSDQVPQEATMKVDALDLGDEDGTTTGSFSARVCLVPKLYETPDLNDCKNIAGRFDTKLMVR